MTGSDNSAIARLEVQVTHLIETTRKLEGKLEDVHGQLGDVKDTLAQSRGGMRVFAWLGFGSFGALLATSAALWQWLKGTH